MDLFCGSGTMHVACAASGRHCISIDKNTVAVDTTKARFNRLLDRTKRGEFQDVAVDFDKL